MFAAFSTTGFDRHTSLVFNPANPETSIEDCLAAVGDQVARELDAHLAAAVDTLLAGSVCSTLTCSCDKSCYDMIAAFLDLLQIFDPKLGICGNRIVRVGAATTPISSFHTTLRQYEEMCAHMVSVTVSEE